MKGTKFPERVNQEDGLLTLNLSRDTFDDVLDVKYDREDLYICSATERMSNESQQDVTERTLSEPPTQAIACLARQCCRN
jgi:hypothetical protein